jgi:hypothetical protein
MTAPTAPAVPLTWGQVRAWRLDHQQLVERAPAERMLEVVAEVCGIHAQVPSSADLQVWARVAEVGPEDVRDALWEQRSLVRTWSMRGTLHLLAADDLPLYVAALRTHDRWWKGAWLRMIGRTEAELRAILDAIRDSLSERPLTREQLADEVAERVGAHAREWMLSGWVSPVVLVDGMVAGVWGHERSGGRIQVTVEPFQRLSGEQRRQLGEEADRLGSFLGAAATISYSG